MRRGLLAAAAAGMVSAGLLVTPPAVASDYQVDHLPRVYRTANWYVNFEPTIARGVDVTVESVKVRSGNVAYPTVYAPKTKKGKRALQRGQTFTVTYTVSTFTEDIEEVYETFTFTTKVFRVVR